MITNRLGWGSCDGSEKMITVKMMRKGDKIWQSDKVNKVTKVTKEKKVIMMTIVRKGAKFTGVKSDKSAKS